MFNFDFDYLLINLCLLLIFYISGRNISNGENYWKCATPSIIAFSLAQGLRYGRGNDYFSYVRRFLFGLNDERSQPIYEFINDLLKTMGVGGYSSFFFYALIFSVCFFVLLKRFVKYAEYLVPLFMVAFIALNEYQVRQALSFSFVFLFMNSCLDISNVYIRNKTLWLKRFNYHFILNLLYAGIYFLIASGIHKGNIPIMLIFLFFLIFTKFPFPYYITIPLVVFCSFFIEKFLNLDWFLPITSRLGDQDEFFASYTDNSDKWFSVEGMDDKYARDNIVQIFEAFGNSALLYFGYKYLKDNNNEKKQYIPFYNFYIFGLLFLLSFRKLEIMQRIGNDIYDFWCIPLSLVLYYRKLLVKSIWEKILFIGLLFFLYNYLKYLFMRGDMTLFLWDTNLILL